MCSSAFPNAIDLSLCGTGNLSHWHECRTLRRRLFHGLAETASSEARSERETHHRTETVRGCNSHEINAGHGGLKTGRQHRAAHDRFDLRTNLRTEELQSF